MLGFVVLSFVRPASEADKAEVSVEEKLPIIVYDWTAAALFEPREAMVTITGREKASKVARETDAGAYRIWP